VETSGNLVAGFAAALGGGLLIGIERERRKRSSSPRAVAGVRTFAMAALAGAGANSLGEPWLVAAGAVLVGALTAIAYWRNRESDPGITTELALLVTYIMGALAITRPALAAGGAVVVTVLLAGRQRLHRFSVDTMSPTEARDGLVFAAAALIILPLLPDVPLAWLGGAVPRRIGGLVVVFMGLQAAGYIALRVAGARLGLALSGLAGGFVSSTSTIAALGMRARETPALLVSCVSGALLSNVATVILLVIVSVAVYAPAMRNLALPLGLALLAAIAVALPGLLGKRSNAAPAVAPGRAFNLWAAIGFSALLTLTTLAVALANRYLGQGYAGAVAALGGAADVHAATASVLSLASGGKIAVADVNLPILLALTTNSGSKAVAAFVGGGPRYGLRVSLGLLLLLAAAWSPPLVSLAWPH